MLIGNSMEFDPVFSSEFLFSTYEPLGRIAVEIGAYPIQFLALAMIPHHTYKNLNRCEERCVRLDWFDNEACVAVTWVKSAALPSEYTTRTGGDCSHCLRKLHEIPTEIISEATFAESVDGAILERAYVLVDFLRAQGVAPTMKRKTVPEPKTIEDVCHEMAPSMKKRRLR